MQKISWWKRLFMSWDALKRYMLQGDATIPLFEKIIADQKQALQDLRGERDRLDKLYQAANDNQIALKTRYEENNKQLQNYKNDKVGLEKELATIKTTLSEKINAHKMLEQEIHQRLNTIGKIERTFFGVTGNKGKGEFGEMQVKTILQKSGLDQNMWVENFAVGTKTVEFAIKSGTDQKWIPVDSKVLETQYDDQRKAIIDKEYLAKIRRQASEISKYLGKKTTTSFGLLVLQNDALLMEIFDQDPGFFATVLRDYKIQIASPASFVQMAWSISNIVDIYERIKGDEQIYHDMMSTLDSVANFARKLKDTQISFNIAMDTHFPAITTKHTNLAKRLDKSGKLKMITNKGDDNGNQKNKTNI